MIFIILFLLTAILPGQSIEIFETFGEYEAHLTPDKDKTYVVNYWATWCGPCVKEMKYFEQLHETYKNSGVEVVLVSIDFKNQYEKRLVPFVKNRNLHSRVIHMRDPKTNDWIDKVDPSWSGALPATQIIRGDRKVFMERNFEDFASLEEVVSPFLDN